MRILVPIDLADPCEDFAREALAFAQACAAEVTMLYAYGLPPTTGAVPLTLVELVTEADRSLSAIIERLGDAGGAIKRRVEQGPPADAIVRIAGDEHFDLVIVSTHGRKGARRLLLGSVAEHVVRRCPCPVLTLRSFCAAAPKNAETAD